MIKKILKKIIPSSIKKKIKERLRKEFENNSSMRCVYDLNIQHQDRALNKVILVTGGTGAIGSAICYRMAVEGGIIGVCDRSIKKINSVIDQIKQSYPSAKLFPVVLDVMDENNIKNVVNDFAKAQGRLDILVNNAGGGAREKNKPLREQDISIVDSVLNTNLRGAILCSKYASEIMVRQQSGKIISMSSVMGLNGKECWTEYSASKSGILGMTRSLALELGEYNIMVNAVSPGMVQQVPFDRALPKRYSHTNALKRYGYTDEVASLVAFLCSDEANYITGQNFVIDGGRSIGLK